MADSKWLITTAKAKNVSESSDYNCIWGTGNVYWVPHRTGM